MALSGNSNDWSGVYALVRILHAGSLISGAPDLSARETEMPVSRILREDAGSTVTYRIRPEKITVKCGDAETEINRKGGLHFYSADDPEPFDNYLFRNARLQVADCEKHKFGFIEKENGQWLIKLNTTLSL